MKRFKLTPRAKQDVNEIWDYLAGDNIAAADRVIDALENAMTKLARTPGIGHRRQVLAGNEYRFFLV
jgi:toxin ParE1/3/4